MSRKLPTELSEAFDLLEEHCRERRRTDLRQGIRELLRRHPSNARVLARSLDWLWRSGQLKEGLDLALPRTTGAEARFTSPIQLGTERALFWMTFLNSLSGWPWVVRWLPEIAPAPNMAQRSRIMAAHLYLSIGRPAEAYALLADLEEKPSGAPEGEERRTALLHLKQRIALELEDPSSGLLVNQALKKLTPASDQIHHWHLEVCRAGFLAMQGEARAALRLLQDSDAAFPKAPEIAPRLYAESRRVLARIQFRSGDQDATLATLAAADHLYRTALPDLSPMRRLEVVSLKSKWGLATDAENDFLAHYPGLRPELQTPESMKFLGDPERHFRIHGPPNDASLVLVPQADEYLRDGRLHAGIPLELRLLGMLALARSFGIHRNLLLALLWPEQWMLHGALDARLSKLIQRLREEHGLKITVERECVFLDEGQNDRVRVDPFRKLPEVLMRLRARDGHGAGYSNDGQEAGYSNDGHEAVYSKTALVADYGLRPTQALALLKSWIEKGWIQRTGKARNARYRIMIGESINGSLEPARPQHPADKQSNGRKSL